MLDHSFVAGKMNPKRRWPPESFQQRGPAEGLLAPLAATLIVEAPAFPCLPLLGSPWAQPGEVMEPRTTALLLHPMSYGQGICK